MLRHFPNSPRRKTLAALALIVLTGAAVLAIKARPGGVPAAQGQQGPPAGERLEAELITLRRHGFEPAEITRSKGQFLLAVDNRSGLEEVNLRLTHETGRVAREERVHRRRLDWRALVNLPPGRYVLTEAGHPEWECRITITAQ